MSDSRGHIPAAGEQLKQQIKCGQVLVAFSVQGREGWVPGEWNLCPRVLLSLGWRDRVQWWNLCPTSKPCILSLALPIFGSGSGPQRDLWFPRSEMRETVGRGIFDPDTVWLRKKQTACVQALSLDKKNLGYRTQKPYYFNWRNRAWRTGSAGEGSSWEDTEQCGSGGADGHPLIEAYSASKL